VVELVLVLVVLLVAVVLVPVVPSWQATEATCPAKAIMPRGGGKQAQVQEAVLEHPWTRVHPPDPFDCQVQLPHGAQVVVVVELVLLVVVVLVPVVVLLVLVLVPVVPHGLAACSHPSPPEVAGGLQVQFGQLFDRNCHPVPTHFQVHCPPQFGGIVVVVVGVVVGQRVVLVELVPVVPVPVVLVVDGQSPHW